jgi:hypothetical protein
MMPSAAQARSLRVGIRASWARSATAVITGLAITVIVGFAGLAVDVANWEVTQRSVQGCGGSGRLFGRHRNEAGGGASPTTQAKGVTASFGFVDGTNNTTFNNLPSTAARADTRADRRPN